VRAARAGGRQRAAGEEARPFGALTPRPQFGCGTARAL
ncbi:MAG: hypothetical protein AVDCRST_MAG88-822, partial [uncultured Thermomicrobiales bacterium]